MTEEQARHAAWVTPTLVVAATTGFAYMLAFSYEAGLCRSYGIPLELISVSITVMGISLVSILSLLILPFCIASLIYMAVQGESGPVVRRIRILTPLLLLFIVDIQLFGRRWRELAIVAALVCFFVFLEFLLPLLTQRGKGTYLQKLRARDEHDNKMLWLPDWAVHRFGLEPVTLFFVAVIAIIVSIGAGRSTALRKEMYLIRQTNPEEVLLKTYQGLMICAPFDRETRTLKRSFRFLKVNSEQGEEFVLEKVGPLAMEPLRTPDD